MAEIGIPASASRYGSMADGKPAEKPLAEMTAGEVCRRCSGTMMKRCR
jgi:hypothetical protein